MVLAIGVGLLALGVADDDVVLSALAAVTIVLAVYVVVLTLWLFRPSRRLPRNLRPPPDQRAREPQLFTLTLRDGSVISAIGVLQDGFVPRRRTDPPFDARDVVEVGAASEAETQSEWERVASGDRRT